MLPRAKETPLAAPLLLPDGAESTATKGDGAKECVAMPRKVVLAFPLMVAALVVAVSICSPRAESILRQSEATLGQAPAAPNKASSASDKASDGSFLMKREPPNVLPTDLLRAQNGQDRFRERLGKKEDGFVHVTERTAEERRYEMKYLQQVRGDPSKCGGDFKTTWKLHPEEYTYSHANNSVEENNDIVTYEKAQRYSCDVRHPKHYDSDKLQVHIERYGPFQGRGNGDWSDFENYVVGDDDLLLPPVGGWSDIENYGVKESSNDKLVMREQCLAHKDIYVRGTFISIVNENGDLQRYPPLHMHHFHLHPYHNNVENKDKILPKRMNGTRLGHDGIGIVGGGNAFMDHHIIAQQHGDSLCDVGDADDFSCLLHLFPPGHGMRVRGSRGFRIDFQTNDVRTADTEGEGDKKGPPELTPLEYYVELAVFWTPKPQVPATFLQISAPHDSLVPTYTYAIPIDDSSSMIYYNYTHDWRDDDDLPVGLPEDERLAAGIKGVQGMGAGTISNIVGHGHMGVFDSLFIFKESNESHKVFNAIDTLRPKNHLLPYIPECHNATLEETKEHVTTLAMQQGGGELVCEVTKPALVWTQTPTGSVDGDDGTERTAKPPSYAYRDRQMDFHCREKFRLEPGDTLTFIAFTKSRPTSTSGRLQRGSFASAIASIYEKGFAQSEHSLVRVDFVSDKALEMVTNDNAKNATAVDDLYAPPALYLNQRWVHGATDEACSNSMIAKSWYAYVNKNISGWNFVPNCDAHRSARLKSMLDQCPESINMTRPKPEKEETHYGKQVEGENFSSE